MAGVRTTDFGSFKVNETNGIVAKRFVITKTSPDSDGVASVGYPTEDGQPEVEGISAENIANGKPIPVANQPGDVYWLECATPYPAEGDFVTCQAATGKGIKVSVSATPQTYYCHAKVLEFNSTTHIAKVKLGFYGQVLS